MVLGFCLTCCSKGFCLQRIFEFATGICLTCCSSGFCYQQIALPLFFLYLVATFAWYYYQSTMQGKELGLKQNCSISDEFIDLEFEAAPTLRAKNQTFR